PDLPESVADATVATWHKKPGDRVERDEVLVDIETDKVVLEVPASEAGILEAIVEEEGATVLSKQLIGRIKLAAVAGEPTADTTEESEPSPDKRHTASLSEESNDALSPAVRRLLAEHSLEASQVKGTGVGGRITREDIEAHLAAAKQAPAVAEAPAAVAPVAARSEKRVPMTRLRKTVANRLLEAKNSTAMLTTFNEVNMKPIMDLRKQYGDQFEARHGIRLGF
ncbi:dihydrolipoamide succinyltransferase, partial [Vibrio vulnificus]